MTPSPNPLQIHQEPAQQQFIASPTMAAFMQSTAFARLLAGPIGGGKSVTCTHTLLDWATLQQPDSKGERRTRFLIVRNTKEQLMSTTWKTVTEWVQPGVHAHWKATEKTLFVEFEHTDEVYGKTTVKSEWMFVALDEPDDVRKALSLEATGAWLNEWRELHPDVIEGLFSRVGRYPPPKENIPITRYGVIMDTNMPVEDTYHWETMENPPSNWSVHIQPPAILTHDEYLLQESEEPTTEPIEDKEKNVWYVNPRADNLRNLLSMYYPNNVPGKKADFIRTFLRCKYGRSLSGVPVYDQTFNPLFHITTDIIKPIVSDAYPIVVGLDFGRTPQAVFGQIDPRGRAVILSQCGAENMGLDAFVATVMRPHIFENYYRNAILVAPDPAGFYKQQMSEVTPVDVLRKAGYKCVNPGTNDPDLRIAAVERLMMRPSIEGRAMFVVNSTCAHLVKGLKYGYKFKTKKNGEAEDRPTKDEFSHDNDALQYLCLVIEGGASGQIGPRARPVQKAASGGWT